jgi:protease-4
MVDVIQAQLDRATDDKRVKAVILKVDSPGGEVMASDEINKANREI